MDKPWKVPYGFDPLAVAVAATLTGVGGMVGGFWLCRATDHHHAAVLKARTCVIVDGNRFCKEPPNAQR